MDAGLASPAVAIVAGGLLLAFGRRLFWLFLAVLGFAVGFLVAEALLDGAGWALLAGLAGGVAGAFLAVVAQRLAVAVAGFAAGALALVRLAQELDWEIGIALLAAALVAGVLGALLLRALFEVALVVFTSLAGATLVTDVVALEPSSRAVALVALTVVGLVLQLGVLRRRRDE